MATEKDYYFREELEIFSSNDLRDLWDKQNDLILNDDKYFRPNNRRTMTIIEEILEERGEQL